MPRAEGESFKKMPMKKSPRKKMEKRYATGDD